MRPIDFLSKPGVHVLQEPSVDRLWFSILRHLYRADKVRAGVAIVVRSGASKMAMTHLLAAAADLSHAKLKAGQLDQDENHRVTQAIRSLARRASSLHVIEVGSVEGALKDLAQLHSAGSLQLVILAGDGDGQRALAGDVSGTFELPVLLAHCESADGVA